MGGSTAGPPAPDGLTAGAAAMIAMLRRGSRDGARAERMNVNPVSNLRQVAAVAAMMAILTPIVMAATAAEDEGTTPRPAGVESLDWAFRFASALHPDPKDKGWAQEAVVLDLALIGALDEAVERAGRIEGWRRGVAYAELASMLGKAGRLGEARALIGRAEEVRKSAAGWYGPRIAAHVAGALPAVGEAALGERLASELAANDSQYVGRAAVTAALGLASRGKTDEALARLREVESSLDPDVAWLRTHAYLDIAGWPGLPEATRKTALEAARRSAEGAPVLVRADLLLAVAGRLLEAGDRETARAVVESAEVAALTLPDTAPLKLLGLASVASSLARLDSESRALDLLARAESLVPNVMIIERPAAYGMIGVAYAAAGDAKASRRVLDLAFSSAESLVNARPRALAVVGICRALGRERLDPDPATRARLEALLDGLRAPW